MLSPGVSCGGMSRRRLLVLVRVGWGFAQLVSFVVELFNGHYGLGFTPPITQLVYLICLAAVTFSASMSGCRSVYAVSSRRRCCVGCRRCCAVCRYAGVPSTRH